MRSARTSRVQLSAVALCLAIHACLLAWGAHRHSPTYDEPAHLSAGLSHWQFGQFDLYRVNPPLVRMVAALPVIAAGSRVDWSRRFTGVRSEFRVGADFVAANGERSLWLFTLARWACIPFSLLGGVVCFAWARDLYGPTAGVLAACLWSFSPNILGHAQLVTPDIGASAFGLTAGYAFWRWLRKPSWTRALTAGVLLGFAELVKATWLVLFLLWPCLWLLWFLRHRAIRRSGTHGNQTRQLGGILLIGLTFLNAGYGFQGSFQRLGDYEFRSATLTNASAGSSNAQAQLTGNRFRDTWCGNIPVPLPRDCLMGIDLQKHDFETHPWGYLRGHWRRGGWPEFYLYAFLVKVPLGTILLSLIAMIGGVFSKGYSRSVSDELVILSVPVLVVLLASSQLGTHAHFRYVLPALPFVFVWTSKAARALELMHWRVAALGAAAGLMSLLSSIAVYPHSLSYFNCLAGGPANGPAHMLDSNFDWGQDLLFLRNWLAKHPDVELTEIAFTGVYDPRDIGVAARHVALAPDFMNKRRRGVASWRPGWYVLSVNALYWHTDYYAYFRHRKPCAVVGFSMCIYHILEDETEARAHEPTTARWASRESLDAPA